MNIICVTCAIACTCVLSLGCSARPQKSFYEEAGWQAEDFFEDPNTIALCEAIHSKDLVSVKRLIESGADVNDVGANGMTPLLWALVSKEAEIFSALADAGADPGVVVESDFNTRGIIAEGTTVAHIAAFHRRPDFFLTLTENNLDPNVLGALPQQPEECTLFNAILAGDGEQMRIRSRELLKLGPDQWILDDAVDLAIRSAEYGIAQDLFEAGANTQHYTGGDWGTMVHLVAGAELKSKSYQARQRAEYLSLVEWLIVHGEDVDAARKEVERWNAALRSGVRYEAAAAARAAELKKREAAKTQIDGPPEDYVDRPVIGVSDPKEFFRSPELVACCQAIDEEDMDRLRSLLDGGLDVNTTGTGGTTLLFWALLNKKFQAFKLLLERGANPNIALTHMMPSRRGQLFDGESPLMIATKVDRKHLSYFLEAIPYTKQPNQQNTLGRTALVTYVASYGDVNVDRVKAILETKVDINLPDNLGLTACHYAVQRHYLDVCRFLLEQGADPTIKDNQGNSLSDTIESELAQQRQPPIAADVEQLLKNLLRQIEELEQKTSADPAK
ncbi:MAG: ankyrin repeat domain-containing protein [Pirellulaceae bacterium]